MSIAKPSLTSGLDPSTIRREWPLITHSAKSPRRFVSDSRHLVAESGHQVRVLTDDLACGECVPVGLQFQRIKSAHFWTSFVPGPQGSMGTLDVEFFGEPSTSLSL